MAFSTKVSIPKRVSEALNPNLATHHRQNAIDVVSIPKRVSEALNLKPHLQRYWIAPVSIPKRVSEALNLLSYTDRCVSS